MTYRDECFSFSVFLPPAACAPRTTASLLLALPCLVYREDAAACQKAQVSDAAYRGRLIRKMLLNIEKKRPTEINLFMALEMLAAAWTATSAAVIENCFRHAGFGHHAPAASPAPEVSESGGDLEEAWDALRSAGDSVPSIVELEDFLCADADVIVHEEFTDDAIIDRVRHEQDSDNDDDHEEKKRQVNPRDVLDAFDVIRNFLGENEDDEAMSSLSSCEARVVKLMQSKAKQTKISDYFH